MDILWAGTEKDHVVCWAKDGTIYVLNQALSQEKILTETYVDPEGIEEKYYSSQVLLVSQRVSKAGRINPELWHKHPIQTSSCWAMCNHGQWMKVSNGKTVPGGPCACCNGKGHMDASDRVRKIYYEKYGRRI